MWNVMTAYVIMHNMIVKAERDDNAGIFSVSWLIQRKG
jgi:hypothetical protein